MACGNSQDIPEADMVRKNNEVLFILSDRNMEDRQLYMALQRYMQDLQLASDNDNVTPQLVGELLCTFLSLVFTNNVQTNSVDDESFDKDVTDPPDSPNVVPFWYKLLTCELCGSFLTDPLTIPCGHTFCKTCIMCVPSSKCPSCDDKYSELCTSSLQSNVLLCNLLEIFIPNQREAVKLRHRGDHCMEQKQYEEAIDVYSEALQLVPTDYRLLGSRCHANACARKYAEALCDACTAITLRADRTKLLTPILAHVFVTPQTNIHQTLEKIAPVEQELLKKERGVPCFACVGINRTMNSTNLNFQKSTQVQLPMIIHEMCVTLKSVHQLVPCSDQEVVENVEMVEPSNDLIRVEHLLCILREMKLKATSQHESLNVTNSVNCATDIRSSQVLAADTTNCVSIGDFECSLCYRLLYEPVTTPCGHVFCRQCLNRSLDHRSSCPLCKHSLGEYLSERRQAVTTVIVLLMRAYLPEEYRHREKLNQDEMAVLSNLGTDDLHEIPIFVCTMAYPTIPCPLHVFEPRYRLMIRRCLESGTRQFGMCSFTNENEADFAEYGCVLDVNDVSFLPDGRSVIDAVGGQRFKVVHRGMLDGYHTAKVEYIDDDEIAESEYEETQRLQTDVYEATLKLFSSLSWSSQRQIIGSYGEIPANNPLTARDPGSTNGPPSVWWTTAILPLNDDTKVRMLGMRSLQERLHVLNEPVMEIMNRNTR